MDSANWDEGRTHLQAVDKGVRAVRKWLEDMESAGSKSVSEAKKTRQEQENLLKAAEMQAKMVAEEHKTEVSQYSEKNKLLVSKVAECKKLIDQERRSHASMISTQKENHKAELTRHEMAAKQTAAAHAEEIAAAKQVLLNLNVLHYRINPAYYYPPFASSVIHFVRSLLVSSLPRPRRQHGIQRQHRAGRYH
jgi:hypothetical protein